MARGAAAHGSMPLWRAGARGGCGLAVHGVAGLGGEFAEGRPSARPKEPLGIGQQFRAASRSHQSSDAVGNQSFRLGLEATQQMLDTGVCLGPGYVALSASPSAVPKRCGRIERSAP